MQLWDSSCYLEPVSARRGETNMEQPTSLAILGLVLAVVFVMQSLQEGWRRAVPQLIGLAFVIAAVGWFFFFKHS